MGVEASIMQTILLNRYLYWSKNLLLDEEGATAIEYALLASLIGATMIGATTALGSSVNKMYTVSMGIITAALGS